MSRASPSLLAYLRDEVERAVAPLAGVERKRMFASDGWFVRGSLFALVSTQGRVVVRLPDPCVLVLVGPAGCGKSTWAAEHVHPDAVVSADRLRAMVGTGERDQRAGTAAFEVLDLIVEHRLKRRLTTVIDTTGLDPARRRSYVERAARASSAACRGRTAGSGASSASSTRPRR